MLQIYTSTYIFTLTLLLSKSNTIPIILNFNLRKLWVPDTQIARDGSRFFLHGQNLYCNKEALGTALDSTVTYPKEQVGRFRELQG